jgi:hypothetical protein
LGAIDRQKATSKQSQQQTNQYSYLEAPENPFFTKAAGFVENYDGGAGAAREAYGRNINDINESGNSFLGAGKTPAYMSDRIRETRMFRNNMDLGRNLNAANQNASQAKQQGFMQLGAATARDLVQTGSTGSSESSGTQTDSPINTGLKVAKLATMFGA